MNKKIDFGIFKQYLEDNNIEKIDCDGNNIWLSLKNRTHRKADVSVDKNFVENFSEQIRSLTNEEWGLKNPMIIVDVDNLKITMVCKNALSENNVFITIIKK